jgi:uncharacterized SAM-binding protein YcdF (DUF218 family)
LQFKALVYLRQSRLWTKIFAGLAVLILLMVVAAWAFPKEVLTVDSGPTKADAIVVLGGGGIERPERAADLFKAREAPLVICSGCGDAPAYRVRLIQSGVTAKDVLVETNSRSTRENAEFTNAILRGRHIHRAIIVTSWYHSRRALHCFEHYAPDMSFYSRPSYAGSLRTESSEQHIARRVTLEYVKLLGYWVCYGACPL